MSQADFPDTIVRFGRLFFRSAPPVVEPIAGHIATQAVLQDLVVRAALTGDRELALQVVIQDPTSPRDEKACRAMFDELVRLQAEQLPF